MNIYVFINPRKLCNFYFYVSGGKVVTNGDSRRHWSFEKERKSIDFDFSAANSSEKKLKKPLEKCELYRIWNEFDDHFFTILFSLFVILYLSLSLLSLLSFPLSLSLFLAQCDF